MFAAIVGFVVFTNGSYVALAQTGDVGQVYEIKSKVQDRLGNRKTDVKVEKFDGTKIKGKITQAGDSSFTIQESKSNQSTVIAIVTRKK